jgi:hypothetical protein
VHFSPCGLQAFDGRALLCYNILTTDLDEAVRLSHQLIAPLSGAAGIAQATETAERSGFRVFCRRGTSLPRRFFFSAPRAS